ncbi:hypothetical protein [Natrinema sp. CGMCC1.2065]|uniref:hypothetical protein n=1 Tax=Natrinema sp. CGMCC1.2065 TaxID=3445767 RepID=UPI003F49C512
MSSDDEMITEPRSYWDIARDGLKSNQRYIWITLALFFGLCFFLTTLILIHVHLTEISFVTAVEEERGPVTQQNPIWAYYGTFVWYGMLCLGAFRRYLRTQGDHDAE